MFLRVLHALALIRLRAAVVADFSGNLTDQLLVDAGNRELRRLLGGDRDAGRDRISHVMAETELQVQVLALDRGTITDAVDLKLLLETLCDADDKVVHQRA